MARANFGAMGPRYLQPCWWRTSRLVICTQGRRGGVDGIDLVAAKTTVNVVLELGAGGSFGHLLCVRWQIAHAPFTPVSGAT